jgi:hypothetical protein
MEVGDFPDFYAKHWETIYRKLMEGSYSPSQVRRVEIPKGKGQMSLPWHSHRQRTLLILPADLRDRLESPIPFIL